MARPKKEVAEATANAMAEVPEHLKQYGDAGNENVGKDDIVIPRLSIVQALSPEADADDAKYIDGAKQGDLFNSLTREIFSEIRLCNIYYEMQYIIWKDRDSGGGFRGMTTNKQEAETMLAALDDSDQCEIQETGVHYCIVVDDKGEPITMNGNPIEIAIPMKSTQLKISRDWNSLIRLKGGPRFAGTWVIKTKKEENDKGKFHNFSVSPGPFASAATAEGANKIYELIKGGKRTVDSSGEEGEDPAKEGKF